MAIFFLVLALFLAMLSCFVVWCRERSNAKDEETVVVGTTSCFVVWCREGSNANDEETSSSALPQIFTLEGVTVQEGESRSMRRETTRL